MLVFKQLSEEPTDERGFFSSFVWFSYAFFKVIFSFFLSRLGLGPRTSHKLISTLYHLSQAQGIGFLVHLNRYIVRMVPFE